MSALKTCTGWHHRNGGIEWSQWYTYENEPCPEHGTMFLVVK